jgi:crotonobetainyl-CoA:carnitine CoA-transferase CaiB-like acyl-CoA transferase
MTSDKREIEPQPLNKYRVLDLTDRRGYLCGKILADMGMDVIKIEPQGGDLDRWKGPFYQDNPDPEKNIYWWSFNTSKRSITLDITKKDDREIFFALASDADIVLESFDPGTTARLGITYDELSKSNPGLIMVSVTGFGQDGPYSRFKAPDIVLQAMSGVAYLTGQPERPPVRTSIPLAYLHASSDAATGTMMALYHRELTGIGQHVDVSAQDCLAWLCFNAYIYWEFDSKFPTRDNQDHTYLTHSIKTVPDVYKCKDGYVLFTPNRGRNGNRTRKFIEWMQETNRANEFLTTMDWEDTVPYFGDRDPSSITPEERDEYKQYRVDTQRQIRQGCEEFVRTKTKKELFDGAIERSYMLAPINDIRDVLEDRQFASRNYWQKVNLPDTGLTLIYPGQPFRSTATSYGIRRPAPHVGEHNSEILEEKRLKSPLPKATKTDRDVGKTEIFKGLKILDFTWVTVGPRAMRYFADHGATVIKVEAPGRSDVGRLLTPFRDGINEPNRSGWFGLYNVNKYGMTIDMTKLKGVELVKKLIKWADVLVESFRPGVMKKYGIDWEEAQKINPRLVYASTSMFGQDGPYATYAGYGYHAAAITGFGYLTGWPDLPPCGALYAYTDHIAPQYLVDAIVAALLEKNRTGKGQYIDQSQNEAALHLLTPAILEYCANKRIWGRNGNRDTFAAPHGIYRCLGDDRWCAIAVETEEEWKLICSVIGKPDLALDDRFKTLVERKKNEDILDRIVESWTLTLTPELVMYTLQQAGVAAGIVETAEDMHRDPQFKHRQHFVQYEHSAAGVHSVDAIPPKFSRTPARQYKPEPSEGEDNAKVCTDILGLSEDEFIELTLDGVFGPVE